MLLQIAHLSTSFSVAGREIKAVKDISFTLDKGETLAIVGESGSGKSVTALSIMRLLPYPLAFHPGGKILFNGQDLLALPLSAMRSIRGKQIGMIFQEPMTALNPLHRVEKQVQEAILLHQSISETAVQKRIDELLDLVDLKDKKRFRRSLPHELSGGQRQRVLIAMALANNPSLLIADEPTTALDVTVQQQILDLLRRLQQQLGMAILLISHDLGIVKRMAHKVGVMKEGELVELNDARALFAAPQHPYTKHLLSSEPKGQAVAAIPSSPVIMKGENVRVWYPKSRGIFGKPKDYVKAVDDVSFELKQGHTLGIVGESGSGKTTLGLAAVRLLRPQGKIYWQGQEVSSLSASKLRPLRRQVQIVFQDPYGSLSPRMTAGDIVAEGLRVHGILKQEEKVKSILKEVGLDPAMIDRYPHEFSGGQRQRLAIARALILEPEVMVLDEPTSALDRSVQAQVVDLLRDLQTRHKLSYIFISHDLRVVKALAHDLMVLKDGQVVEKGRAADIFAHPSHPYTQALLKAALS
ncbi:MAG: ABC transporter ATP-binding protein [Dongiaceae bacterium]